MADTEQMNAMQQPADQSVGSDAADRKPIPSPTVPKNERTNLYKLPETDSGTIIFNTDPLIIKYHYEIDYIHSYAQDTPFFIGLSEGRLMGSRTEDGYTYATPRGHAMDFDQSSKGGKPTTWVELPREGKIHTFTTCFFGGEAFLNETPFTLILVEFEGVDTLFLSRLVGIEGDKVKIGMPVYAQFVRNSKFKATDVYFVPLNEQ